MKLWYPMQWTTSKSHNIPNTWMHTNRILVILMFLKSCKIFIHIAIKLHITIWVKGRIFPSRSNQVASDSLYCVIMTPHCIVDESVTLVHWKLNVRPGITGEIHQNSLFRSIFSRFIKWRSTSIYYQDHLWYCSDLLLPSNMSTVFSILLVNTLWVSVTLPDWLSVFTSNPKKSYKSSSTVNDRPESSSSLMNSSILSWSESK